MTSQELATMPINQLLDMTEQKFQNAPRGIVFEKEKSYVLQVFRKNDYLEKVAKNNPLSLLDAMTNVALLGLSLNPAKKQAYLVPRNETICLDPSYMGMCDMATQSGAIKFVQAKLVYENDEYINNGVDREPTHTYKAFGDRGAIVGGYCVAKTSEGDYLTTEMPVEIINSVRDRSEAAKKQSGPWFTDYEEMAKKTIIRNASKTWPKTETLERLQMAVELSNQNEGFEPLVSSPNVSDYSDEQKKHFDYLIESNDSMGIHVFMCSLDEGVQTGLYNSFENGTITKFKKLVSKMQQEGYSQIVDIETVISESMVSGDDLAAKELLDGLSEEVVAFMCDRNDHEFGAYVRQCNEELAA